MNRGFRASRKGKQCPSVSCKNLVAHPDILRSRDRSGWARPPWPDDLPTVCLPTWFLRKLKKIRFSSGFIETDAPLRCPRRCFLFARARQIEDLRQSDLFTSVRISDYLFTRDRLFAELNLDQEELKLYDQIAENLSVDAPLPDLVIYLQASVDAVMRRLAQRNSRYDRFVDRHYVEKLIDAYARFFHSYDEGPLLIVNASQIDPVNNDSDYEQLFRQIERTTGGRHFFNPIAAALG